MNSTPENILTDIEIRRLQLAASGETNKRIAYIEWVSEPTIKISLREAKKKLKASSLTETIKLTVQDWVLRYVSFYQEPERPTFLQKEVIDLISQGLMYKDISEKLWISLSGVKGRLEDARKRMWARNVKHAVAINTILDSNKDVSK